VVHSPAPLVVVLRVFSGIGWHLSSVPFLVAAFFGGRFVGGCLRGSWHPDRDLDQGPRGIRA
jgi:hypothetical protein